MKRIILIVTVAMALMGLSAARWETITNLSHVYDLMFTDQGAYFSTWGGVGCEWSGSVNGQQPAILTTADGLASNDVRNIEYIESNHSLWLGTAFDGITIVHANGVQQMNVSLGLPSNHVAGIVEHGSNIIVATGNGLASYYYLEGVNFPLLLHSYNTQTTQGLLSNSIDAMELAANNYLYLSSTAGVNFVHLDSLDVDSAWHSFSGSPVGTGNANKLSSTESKLIVATPYSVCVRSIDPWEAGWQVFDQSSGLIEDVISNAAMDHLGRLWVSYGIWDEDNLIYSRNTDTVLTCVDSAGSQSHVSGSAIGLGENCVSKIVGADNKVYFCTWGGGILYQLDGDSQYYAFEPNAIGFPKIRNIATDANHAAWFSSGSLNTMQLRKSALGACRYLNGEWDTFTVANSPIHTDNVYTVAVDSRNRKWFGTYAVDADNSPEGWRNGISIYDDADGSWTYLNRQGRHPWLESIQDYGPVVPGSDGVLGNTDLHISRDLYGNMLVSCFDDGVTVFDADDNKIGEFQIPNSVLQRVIYSYHSGSEYFFGTYNDRGLVIWDDDSIPSTNGDHWIIPEPAELSNCEVYGVVSVETPYEGRQHWIAVSNGLFMWDGTDWYKWDTSIKRYKYNKATHDWDNDLLYYVDEERLYGSVRTTPTSIFLDPFNRIWIGSLEHGVSMYDPDTERFTNYFKENSPLISDYITAFGYIPHEGKLLIGTPEGMNTLEIGYLIKPAAEMEKLLIGPNPFRPASDGTVRIENDNETSTLPQGENKCRIYDASGALVIVLEENEFARFDWDGKNAAGNRCASGVYFVVVTDATGERRTGKIAVIN
jgi:hypothetical protein